LQNHQGTKVTKTGLKQNEAVMGAAVVLTQRPTQPSPGGGKQIFTIKQSVFISEIGAKITWAHMKITWAHIRAEKGGIGEQD
jgi:hypothetical protein